MGMMGGGQGGSTVKSWIREAGDIPHSSRLDPRRGVFIHLSGTHDCESFSSGERKSPLEAWHCLSTTAEKEAWYAICCVCDLRWMKGAVCVDEENHVSGSGNLLVL